MVNIQGSLNINYALTKDLKYENANSAQKEIFNIFDTNGDKKISESELETFQRNFSEGEVTKQAVDEYISVMEEAFGINLKSNKSIETTKPIQDFSKECENLLREMQQKKDEVIKIFKFIIILNFFNSISLEFYKYRV